MLPELFVSKSLQKNNQLARRSSSGVLMFVSVFRHTFTALSAQLVKLSPLH